MKTEPMPTLDRHAKAIFKELSGKFTGAREITVTALSGSVIRNPSQTEETKCWSVEVKIISKVNK